jgi:hypothetical protein
MDFFIFKGSGVFDSVGEQHEQVFLPEGIEHKHAAS